MLLLYTETEQKLHEKQRRESYRLGVFKTGSSRTKQMNDRDTAKPERRMEKGMGRRPVKG